MKFKHGDKVKINMEEAFYNEEVEVEESEDGTYQFLEVATGDLKVFLNVICATATFTVEHCDYKSKKGNIYRDSLGNAYQIVLKEFEDLGITKPFCEGDLICA